MYEAHLGLSERPFSIAPDPRYLFLGRHHSDALAHLLYGVGERGGFIQLTGAVGTGKTTLTRALLEQLPPSVDVALILNPALSARELLHAICEELGVALPPRARNAPALTAALRDYLLDAFSRGRHTVVLVDEAQNLSPAALEQVRMLTNLETNREKLLQIILVGQPELRDLLARHDLRQVAQRVTARFHLTPLTFAETRQYIRHRLQTAGCHRQLFSTAAMRAIHRRAGGIPRLINIICDRALLGVYAIDRQHVTVAIARRAAAEVAGRQRRWPRLVLGSAAAGLAAVLLVAAPLLNQPQPANPAPAVQAAPPTLAERIRQNDPQLDSGAALARLFELWNGRYRTDNGRTACQQAQAQGLRCALEAVSWSTLLSRDLPAVLELSGPQESRHGVLLVGFQGANAMLDLGGERLRVPQTALLGAWTGSSVALWRPPAEIDGAILPGSRGPMVAWLGRQLSRIDGQDAPAGDVYDAALRRRVLAFQRAHGLAVDGIVGDNTLLHLLLAAPDPAAPHLSRN